MYADRVQSQGTVTQRVGEILRHRTAGNAIALPGTNIEQINTVDVRDRARYWNANRFMFKSMKDGSAAPKPKFKTKKKSKSPTECDDSFHHDQLDKTQICKLSEVVFDEEFWVYGEVTHRQS